jgi:ribosomal protein L40E
MSKETLGYVKLEWTCPKCNSRNPGPEKTCLSCGAPQPDNVQFQQAEKQELIQDREELEKAKSAPDIHCGFCGTRNAFGTANCTQCGADLTKGVKREAGRVIGAFQTAPVPQIACPSCGAMNPDTALKCAQCGAGIGLKPTPAPAPAAPASKRNPVWIIVGTVLLLLCLCGMIALFIAASRTEAQSAVVDSVKWVSSIEIEALQPVSRQGWKDEIPTDASLGACVEKVHHVQDQPAPDSNKVCGTPYTVDKGSGYAEVVQDCQYEVLQEFCDYTVLDWQGVAVATQQGTDLLPAWPAPQLGADQRTGAQQQEFVVIFIASDEIVTYNPSSLAEFQQFETGSEWILNINAIGQVVSVEPK